MSIFHYKDKTQQLLSYPPHFDRRVACCRCVAMIVTAFSSLPLVVVVVVAKLLCRDQSYPEPQITVARVTVTSWPVPAAVQKTLNPLVKGYHWASRFSTLRGDKREEEEHEEHDVRDSIAGGAVVKYKSFKHCSPNIRSDKEKLNIDLESWTHEHIARTIQTGAETLVEELSLMEI